MGCRKFAWRKDQETVIRAAPLSRQKVARLQSASHFASLNKFIYPAHVVGNLRSVAATAPRSEFKQHRSMLSVRKFNMGYSLSEAKSSNGLLAHISHHFFVGRRKRSGILYANINAIGILGFYLLANAQNRGFPIPN